MTTIEEARERERQTLPKFEAHHNDRAWWVTLTNLNIPVESWDRICQLVNNGFYSNPAEATAAGIRVLTHELPLEA